MVIIFAKKAKNILEKATGLIRKDQPQALFLKTRFGIHTFGLKFPIDIVILDRKNRIVKLKKGLRPNNIFLWNPLYDRVLELPEGTIEKKGIKIYKTVELKTS